MICNYEADRANSNQNSRKKVLVAIRALKEAGFYGESQNVKSMKPIKVYKHEKISSADKKKGKIPKKGL
jgi:hypothetical protein